MLLHQLESEQYQTSATTNTFNYILAAVFFPGKSGSAGGIGSRLTELWFYIPLHTK